MAHVIQVAKNHVGPIAPVAHTEFVVYCTFPLLSIHKNFVKLLFCQTDVIIREVVVVVPLTSSDVAGLAVFIPTQLGTLIINAHACDEENH
ncbi:MAG: hypothetical protein WCL02_05090 [bacterium]